MGRNASDQFIVHEGYAHDKAHGLFSDRGPLLITSCRSGEKLACAIVDSYSRFARDSGSCRDVRVLENVDSQFSDSETNVRLASHVGGADAFVVQSLYDPECGRSVDENYMALLIAARALKEHGARYVTAVVPYLAYARQDKPTRFTREATTARLMADLGVESGIDRIMTWHPHSRQVEGFYGTTPVSMLEPYDLFGEQYSDYRNDPETILIAPDAGAAKMVTHVARLMGLNAAIASKFRPAPEAVENAEIIGNFAGKKRAIILDDIISSGGTLRAVTEKLAGEIGIPEIMLGVSHNLCTDKAYDLLDELHRDHGLTRVTTTDSIPQTKRFRRVPFLQVSTLAQRLARAINRIHYDRSVSEIFHSPEGE